MNFTFVTPPRLVASWGAATDGRLAAEAARLGKRPLVVAGGSLRRSGALDDLLVTLRQVGLNPTVHEGVPPEPDVDALQACLEAVERDQADSVLGIGGGSVLDVAKGAAALAGRGATARDFFTGRQTVPETGGLPILAAPTTAGTGSEATWVGVFTDKQAEQKRKASIRGGAMMPAVALLDAELTVSCPPHVTAQSGMDAFVQAVESYTSNGANPFTDALSFKAAAQCGAWIEAAVSGTGDDHRTARERMLLASYMAGAALNTSRLGLVHGLAHPIGAVTGAAHGLICGLLMPAVMRFNREDEATNVRYHNVARWLGFGPTNDPLASTDIVGDFITAIEVRLDALGIPRRLSEIGLSGEDLGYIAREAMSSGSTKANPRPVSEAEAYAVAASVL